MLKKDSAPLSSLAGNKLRNRSFIADTRSKCQKMFTDFFARVPDFQPFHPHAGPFHHNVHCGILHQAETRGGWRVVRTGPLFDDDATTINATKFHAAVGRALRAYCAQLRTEPWGSSAWTKLIKKLKATA